MAGLASARRSSALRAVVALNIERVGTELDRPGNGDPGLRRARLATLGSLATTVLTSLFMPSIGLFSEPDPRWIALGALGIVLFSATQAGALYATATPWLGERTRRGLYAGFGVAALLSVPLVAPVGGPDWETWAWLGASLIGSALLLVGRWSAVGVTVLTIAVAAAIGWWGEGSAAEYALITAGIGLAIAGFNVLQISLWNLLVMAQRGRAAQARLIATEERLRFARDVHDLLGHSLSVIALKAELAARLAPVDAERAGQEAAEVRRLAATALTDLRATVHGYRTVDLRDQVAAVEQVLTASGVRCTVTQPAGELPASVADQLVAVLREASTNVLRHSKAGWCTIEIQRDGDEVRMTVANDGADGAGPDRHSYGLRGLTERLAGAGGTLRHRSAAGVFTLDVTVRAAP